MTIMTFKLIDAAQVQGLPKWNARIYKGEKFLFTPEEFFGATEDEARLKARKYLKQVSSEDYSAAMTAIKPAPIKAEGENHHFAGKVWLWHAEHGFKRVEPEQVAGLEWAGWVKRGPRSKVDA